ncbi:hypothetical protein LIER_30093 [Lithospermum erythrorhizon]|uniref:GBF-interacting protein 1 N-terminal domain-containing protein n=1 Tax=Lithospermum erythrorhizon TaxID=34254 RepID=A0AAV3RPQ5_LITER
MNIGGGGVGGVSIPKSLRKTIEDIKEIAGGKHSDDDVYAMLKECNMDPNETAQRLLYLDTFHEVKRKRGKKKVDVGHSPNDYRWSSSMQRRGARGGRVSYSSNISEDSGLRRKGISRQENGISNYRGGSSRVPTTVVHKRDDNAVPSVSRGPKNASDEHCDTAPQVSSGYISSSSKSLAPSCPTNSDTALSPQGPGAAGKIKCENGTLGSSTESKSVRNDAKLGTSREVQTVPEITNPSSKMVPSISQATKAYHLPEPSHEISSTITDLTLGVRDNHSSWPTEQVYNVPKGVVSHAGTVKPQSTETSLDQTTPELDRKLENLSVSSHHPVTFPDHLQVPEALRRGLTFGSLDAALGQSGNSENISILMNENSSVADLVIEEPSHRNHHASPTDKEGDGSLSPPSHPQMTGTLSTLRDDETSAGIQKFDQSNQDRSRPAPHIPLLQTAPDYGFGIIPPLLAPHITHLEGAEPQASNPTAPSTSGSTPPVTQPSGLAQNSFALPPHLLPYLRQPYPSNLYPYNPYFPHLFMPHTAHQFLGHNILPQHPTGSNVYASEGSKYVVPPILKTSSVGGNMTHFGVPSGYGSFGASNVGYSSSPAFTSGNSSSTEDLMAAEFKENNMYAATLKKNEEAHTWTATPGRDMSTLPANYFYNIPPGHHVAFPSHSTHGPPFPGVYHPNQSHPLSAPSSLQSFSQQPQAAGGTIESVVPSSQLPQSQINWNN